MLEIATASLNSFAKNAEQKDVPYEEPIFVLSSSQLQEIISRAIQDATEPLKVEINKMRIELNLQTMRIDDAFEAIEDIDNTTSRKPTPMQRDNAKTLRAILAANNGKMLLKEARQQMHMADYAFSKLLATMTDYIEMRPYHLNKSKKVLILR